MSFTIDETELQRHAMRLQEAREDVAQIAARDFHRRLRALGLGGGGTPKDQDVEAVADELLRRGWIDVSR